MSSKHDNQSDFGRFLAGEDTQLSALYRKLPPAEPDEQLDAAVLLLAHRAINPQLVAAPRHALVKPRRGWVIGLGSAAGLVLAAGIAWQLRTTIERDAASVAINSAAPAHDVVVVGTIESQTPAEAAAAPPPPPAPSAPASPAKSAVPASTATTADATAKRMQPPTDFERRNDARQRREESGVTEYTLSSGAAGTTPRPAPFTKQSAQPVAEPFPADVDATAKQRDSKAAAPQTEESAAPPLAATNSVERKAELATGGNRAEVLDSESTAAPTPPKKLKESIGPATPSRSAALARNARLEPKAWIALMQELVRDGREAEARENLALFRRKHPRYPLPDELKALMPPAP